MAHEALATANSHIMKAVVQSPLEYRTAAVAATAMASRPGEFEMEAETAVSFFKRVFS